MDDLIIEVDDSLAGVAVLRLTGPLTMRTLFDLQDTARSRAADSIVIDLAGVPYIDSAGLGAMLGVMASCQRQGKGFAACGVSDRVKTLFEMTRVDSLVPLFDTAERARAGVARPAEA